MVLKISDVSLGTIRTLMVVQGKKYQAAIIGFVEVTIWVFAIRHVMLHLDNIVNVFGYSTGFAIGTFLGILIEQKVGSGFIQMQVISKHHIDKISTELWKNNFGATLIPGEGVRGGVAVIVLTLTRKRQKEAVRIIEGIDPKAFITVQSAIPSRGFIQLRK
jgi:uncharacterized protein YebE (UPF0316 family)